MVLWFCGGIFILIVEWYVFIFFLLLLTRFLSSSPLPLFPKVIELHPDLREELLKKLAHSLRVIRAGVVFQSALWILGEYSESKV